MNEADSFEVERVGLGSLEPLLTIHEAAATLRVSEQTIWRRVRTGELRAVQLGGPGSTVRIPCEAIRQLQRAYGVVQ